VSLIKRSYWQQGALILVLAGLLASCDTKNEPQVPAPTVATPNVVGQPQAAATSAITGAGLVVGTVSTQSSLNVPSGNVISQSVAPGVVVSPGTVVNLVVSNGSVAVPNIVGMTQAAAATALTAAGLTLGTVTAASSATVPAGTIIGQTPAAAAMAVSGSAVNVSLSVGPAASFAYVANAGDKTISPYSISAAGQLAPLGAAIPVPGSTELYTAKIDPSGQFLYVLDFASPGGVFGFVIQSDGSLIALNGGVSYPTGNDPTSIAFDATGSFLYVLNMADNSISAFSLGATGALGALTTYPIVAPVANPQARQMIGAGNYLYVAEYANNAVEVFSITAGTGVLTQGVTGSPFPTDTGPYSLVADPSGAVLYTANIASSGAGSISPFTINSSGVLTSASVLPLAIPAVNYISIDPQGKFLFVTESNALAVYPITLSTAALGAPVVAPAFAAGSVPISVSVDLTGQFVYVADYGLDSVSQFTMDTGTGVLTPMQVPTVAAGIGPVTIAIH
jgi:6-phosphogluconolactonase